MEFKDYFWGQWMEKDLSGWFEGFTQAGPSTNNGLECINRTLKDAYTLRERLPISCFLGKAMDIVADWSVSAEKETFQTSPTTSLEVWTLAWQWVRSRPTIRNASVGSLPLIFI